MRAEAEHYKIREMSIEEEDGCQEDEERHNVQSAGNRQKLSISEKINRDLDETALMLEKLTQSLFPVEMGGGGGDEGSGVVKRVYRKSCHSTVSASISEPDLTVVC